MSAHPTIAIVISNITIIIGYDYNGPCASEFRNLFAVRQIQLFAYKRLQLSCSGVLEAVDSGILPVTPTTNTYCNLLALLDRNALNEIQFGEVNDK